MYWIMKFNHKSLGGFDITVSAFTGPPSARVMVTKRHRIMVTIDPEALVKALGWKAAKSKRRTSRLAGGAIELVDLGGFDIK